MSKVVTVFGATGFVGSAVARTLVVNGWHVRGVTRDPNGPKATSLKNEGIQIVYVDPDNINSIIDALRGSTACFVQTQTDFSNHREEVTHGKRIADACRDAGVGHVIYSSQLSVVKVTGMNARHMDSKAEVELYMHEIGVPLTCVVIPFTYEQLLVPPYRAAIKDGVYEIGIPMGYTPLHMISTEDVGPVVQKILSTPREYMNKSLSICGEKMTIKEMAGIFTRTLQPRLFRDKQVTVEQFGQRDSHSSHDLANMFHFYCRVDQRASVDMTQRLYPGVQTLEQWLRNNRDIVMASMEQNSSMPSQLYAM